MVSGGSKGCNSIKVWSFPEGNFLKNLEGHEYYVLSVSISMNCRYIVSGSEDKMIKVWSIDSMTELKTLTGHTKHVNSVAITNDSQMIISGSADESIKLWNLETGELFHTFDQH